jgi:hypothetical protein
MRKTIDWFKELEEDTAEMVEDAKAWLKDNPDEDLEDLLTRFEEDEDSEPFYLHEFVDGRGYFIYLDDESIKEAIDCLSQLGAWEETDSGLWEGQDFREEINSRAFWTYKNALREKVRNKLLELKINSEVYELEN